MHPIYCLQCKQEIGQGDAHCRFCGHNQTVPPFALVAVEPPAPVAAVAAVASEAASVYVTVHNNTKGGGNTGWFVATLLLLYTTPLGCIAGPVTALFVVAIGAALTVGMMSFITVLLYLLRFTPALFAALLAFALGKVLTVPVEKKRLIIGGIIAAGLAANGLVLYLLRAL